MNMNIELKGVKRSDWIEQIAFCVQTIEYSKQDVIIKIVDIEDENDLEPIHLVLLACLTEHCVKCNCESIRLRGNSTIINHVKNILKFNKYWGDDSVNYIECEDNNILNLWKINNDGIETYSRLVHDYLRRGKLKIKICQQLRIV